MASKQASLILRLIDGVSGPAKGIVSSLTSVNNAVNRMTAMSMAPARAVNNMARNMRRNAADVSVMSTATTIGLAAASKAVYDFEKAGNRMQAFGLLDDAQRANLENEAKRLNRFFPQTNKLIVDAAGELFRAGLTYEQAMGALQGTLQLSLAGDIDTQKAADIATNIMYAMKLPMDTYEQVQASLKRVNDMLAYGATKSNTDIQLMSDTFRYIGPLAAVAGMGIEEVTALTMELAKAGIKGSEAGVAMRSALVRMAKPTKPMIAAFNRLGISMSDYVSYKEKIEASSITSSLLAEGYELDHLSKDIQAILDDPSLASAPQRMLARLSDLIVGEVGDETVRDRITENLQDAILAGGQKVDLRKLLGTLRDKGATITDIAQIFDVRMGARLAAIMFSDLDAAVDDVNKNFAGTSERMSKLMIKGIVGVVLELTAAAENLAIAVADSGVLGTAMTWISSLTDSLVSVSLLNPKLLEFATYGILALATLAPLGFAASGAAAALGLMINPLTWVVGGLGYLAAINYKQITSFFEDTGHAFKRDLNPAILRRVGDGFDWIRDRIGALGKDRRFGDSWGRTTYLLGSGLAKGVNTAYDVLSRFSRTRFATAWADGFVTAFDRISSAIDTMLEKARSIETSLQPIFDALNSQLGADVGRVLGEISGYGLALAGAAVGFSIIAGPLRLFANAALLLTGIKPAWALVSFLTGLGSAGASSAAGIGAAATATSGLARALGMLSRVGLAAGGLLYVASWLKEVGDNQDQIEQMHKDRIARLSPEEQDRYARTPGNQLKSWLDRKHARNWDVGNDSLGSRSRYSRNKRRPMQGPPVDPLAGYRDRPLPPSLMNENLAPVITPKLDTTGLGVEARAAGFAMKSELSITATPIVNSSSIDAALAKARALVGMLNSLGGTINTGIVVPDTGGPKFGGARAGGGPVRRGLTYKVGERGEELFTPDEDGTIIPNHHLGRGGTGSGGGREGARVSMQVTQNITSGDPESAARKLVSALERQLVRSRQTSMDGRPNYET